MPKAVEEVAGRHAQALDAIVFSQRRGGWTVGGGGGANVCVQLTHIIHISLGWSIRFTTVSRVFAHSPATTAVCHRQSTSGSYSLHETHLLLRKLTAT
jgi:hypothetical protein